jgi:uncharacterized membrane protein
MARSRWRQRSDGVYQIVGKGPRLRRAALALVTLLVAIAMSIAVVSATAVYVVIGFPFLVVSSVYLALRLARRHPRRRQASSATVLTLARRGRLAAGARDAGA